MNQYSEEHILSFLKDLIGEDKITLHSDIFFDTGVRGDDFHEMIEAYQKAFKVDMTNYLWYFHTDEEGESIGVGFFKPPYELVKRIPVTPQMMLDFANTGKWTIEYPAHKLPKRRYDLILNSILVYGFFVFLIIYLLREYVFN